MKTIKHIFYLSAVVFILNSCSQPEGNFPGSEYMPDMAHSVAYEANHYTYYYYNTWDSASVIPYKELVNPNYTVNGTVPRGYAGLHLPKADQQEKMMNVLRGKDRVNSIAVPVNGHVPYYYEDTEPERERATAEIIENPYPITAEGLEHGEFLYNTFCGICHGEKGNGLGYLVSEDNPAAAYPAAPANFLIPEFLEASNGRYYHAIMHGKNVMGAYDDKMNYKERWEVIHWIRHLQAKDQGKEDNENVNTLQAELGTPAARMDPMAAASATDDAAVPKPAVGDDELIKTEALGAGEGAAGSGQK